MTTTFFRFKKWIKGLIKAVLPYRLYAFILACYRTAVFNVPSFFKKALSKLFFKRKTLITIPTGRFQIYVDPNNGHTDIMLYINRSRDKEVTDVMDMYLNTGSTFIDVGANIGYETLWGSKLVGNEGNVIAFEPVPKIASQLGQSIFQNGFKNIKLIQKGVSDKAEKVKIYLSERDAGSSSILNSQNNTNSIEIETVTLDKALENLSRIDLIKIDVEGYEPQVLHGARQILAKYAPPIVFEYQPYLYDPAYKNILSLLSEEYGYTLYHLETKNKVVIEKKKINEFTNSLLEEKSLVNILAIII